MASRVDIKIHRAWVHESQPDRIHYIMWANGHGRRLYATEGSIMFEELYRILLENGYAGLKYLTRHKMVLSES